MTDYQIKLVEQVKTYLDTNLPTFVSCFSCNNHYAFRLYLKDKIGEEVDLSDKNSLSLSRKASYNHPSQHRVCFGLFLKTLESSGVSNYRSQFIWMPYLKPVRQENANFTWMTATQLLKHVRYPKTHLGLDYEVKLYRPEEYVFNDADAIGPYYTIIFDFKDLTYIEIKYILFWSRYATEFISNFIFLDVLMLKEKYPEEELHNLLIMASLYLRMHFGNIYVSLGQCISVFGKFVTKEFLVNSLKQNPWGNVSEIFQRNSHHFNNAYEEFDAKFRGTFDALKDRVLVLKKPNSVTFEIDLYKFLEEEEVEYRMSQYEKLYPYYKSEELREIRED